LFNKMLIANRGEIACRVIATAQRLGIKTVAVYSSADSHAKHVNLADESVGIGPDPSSESYLVADKILAAARTLGVDAVHPGYGFLSENSDFAQAVCDLDLAFVGPSPESIAAMGDKIGSKKIAKDAGINVIPGYIGEIKNEGQAIELAREIGFPVMIKASRGGGGKGMRIAYDEDSIKTALPLAQGEARTSFGDDRLLVEKFIEDPRHIEIQILADRQGNIVHLNERECSIQRRHQKVIEESPSPFVDPAMRALMGEQAIRLAKEVQYDSVGTVEFVVSPEKKFYFLEMNTRLQVEHPVTEMISGLDLVEQMIRVAAGETLSFNQADVSISGWAIEARLYAEDPGKGFLPATGVLRRYKEPEFVSGCRVDSGVEEGDEVTVFYDPMMAKVIGHGQDRQEAIEILRKSLDTFSIRGVANNLLFLTAILNRSEFLSGDLSTGFISRLYPDGFRCDAPQGFEKLIFVSAAIFIHISQILRGALISGVTDKDRYVVPMDWVVAIGSEEILITIVPTKGGFKVTQNGRTEVILSDWYPGEAVFHGSLRGEKIILQVEKTRGSYTLWGRGVLVNISVRTRRSAELMARMPEKHKGNNGGRLVSPMPGKVVSIFVEKGQKVRAGDSLLTIDAMKMENLLCAEGEGVVEMVHVAPGDSLSVEQVILEITPTADT
jgi:propionyl-CoA carboxylase alpha chain